MSLLAKIRRAFSGAKLSEDDVVRRIEKLERCHREIGHDLRGSEMKISRLKKLIEAMPAGKAELFDMMDDAMDQVDKGWGKKI